MGLIASILFALSYFAGVDDFTLSTTPNRASKIKLTTETYSRLSVVIPAYNEELYISSTLVRVLNAFQDGCQVIVCDDASTDLTIYNAETVIEPPFLLLKRNQNGGKTAAVLSALTEATGEFVVIQDADLEYDPADIPRLLNVAMERGGVVYGRRPSLWHRPSRWVLAGGVLLVDLWLLVVYRRWVRDHATCYKLMPTQLMRDLDLQSSGFEGCVEITAKLMRMGVSIHQVPISYQPRSAKEGKKLTWRYGWTALQAVWRWRKWMPPPAETDRQAVAAREAADDVNDSRSKTIPERLRL